MKHNLAQFTASAAGRVTTLPVPDCRGPVGNELHSAFPGPWRLGAVLAASAALLLPAAPARAQYAGNNALSFNAASSQFVAVPGFGNIIPTNEVTIEFWAYTTQTAQQSAFMQEPDSATNRFQAHLNYLTGLTYWDFGNINTSGRLAYFSPVGSLNHWTHYAFVASFSGNYMRIFTNGALFASKTGMTPCARGDFQLRLGGNNGYFYTGLLDDFRVWDRARSGDEILAGKDHPLSGAESNLVLYFRFDATSGTTLTNLAIATGAAYNGALSNSPPWVVGAPQLSVSPAPTTLPATGVTATTATLQGAVNPEGAVTTSSFQYGLTTNYGSVTSPKSQAAGNLAIAVNSALTGLSPSAIYHFRLLATNSAGGAFGADQTFHTLGWTNVVSTTNDTGAGSLREAIAATLPTGIIYCAPELSGQTITLTNGQLLLTNSLTIDASVLPGGLALSGNHNSRIFFLTNQANLTLYSLTLTNGRVVADDGGAIYISAGCELGMTNCWLAGNSVVGPPGIDGLPGTGTTRIPPTVGGSGRGGAIYNAGTLRLNRTTLSGNQSAGGAGGRGINQPSNYSAFDGASGGDGLGGAIYNLGSANLVFCCLSNNAAAGGRGGRGASVGWNGSGSRGGAGGRGCGGALYCAGQASFAQGALAGNRASGGDGGDGGDGGSEIQSEANGIDSVAVGGAGGGGWGGGLFNAGTMPLTQVTVTGNTGNGGHGGSGGMGASSTTPHGIGGAGGTGGAGGSACGGIYTSNHLVLQQITLAANASLGGLGGNGGLPGQAPDPGAVAGAHGAAGASGCGGLQNAFGQCSLLNSIVAANLGSQQPDVSGQFSSLGHNLLGIVEGSTGFASGADQDLLGSAAAPLDPGLKPLANYGGPIPTLSLLPGSPAVDAGDDAITTTYTTDARGLGFPRLRGQHVDIGAFEFDLSVYTPPVLLSASALMVSLDPATHLGGLTMAASANPEGLPAFIWLQYGIGAGYGINTAPVALGYDVSPVATALPLNLLAPGLTWHYRVVVTNAAGATFGSDQAVTVSRLGDFNGDGVVDQSEFASVLANLHGTGVVSDSDLNLVLPRYWPASQWLSLTEVAGLGGTNVTFTLTNSLTVAFSVEYTTNLTDWLPLGQATPRYLFTDTNAPALPQRFYRLRWP